VETAIEAERLKIPEHPQKSFLVHVARILRRAKQIHGEPEHTVVVQADQLLESVVVAALRRPDQGIHLLGGAGARYLGCVQLPSFPDLFYWTHLFKIRHAAAQRLPEPGFRAVLVSS
jgi:hypothetical protein